jgi:hypothetical protein
MRQLFEDPADESAARAERLTESATRQFLNSLTSKKEPRMNEAKSKPAVIEATTEPKPTKPAAAPTITFGEVARLLGVAVNELEVWARRGLLPLAFNGDTHPHHWSWNRDAMTRWCESMKSELAKAQESRL